MKKGLRIVGIILLAVLLLIVLLFYVDRKQREQLDNYPYEPDTPAPDPHDGTFVSQHGTMTFNGDGESLVFNFDEELAGLAGLPAGEQNGTYVFLSGDLPPHGSVDVRYDIAHEWRISLGDTSVVIDLGLASKDGSTAQVGVDMVTDTRIPMLFQKDGKFFSVIFEKE
ncbi:MAG: hypothetical protein IJF87_10310 [Erysipelotrichaceae bacterium]|nr:hypothetical protein [Erysipelotrichaceae bacterium]